MQNALAAQWAWWIKRASDLTFDTFHKVDTKAGVPAQALEIASTNREKAGAYDPAPWSTLRRSLRLASLAPRGFTFVDIGCGKGKVLLSALGLPFQRIIGVDFSPLLCRIAERNLSSVRFVHRRCPSVEIICADATEYQVPEQSTIFFFYNPFSYEVMEAVLANIVDGHKRAPCARFLIFYATSSSMPKINAFLEAQAGDGARLIVSGQLGQRSINILELSEFQ